MSTTTPITATPPTRCPAVHVGAIVPCPAEELTPLFDWLGARRAPPQPLQFTRGTALPDGRLDLCKQSLGQENCRALFQSASGHPWLAHLLLGTNGLGDDGAAALATWLRHQHAGPALRTLYLGCNGIRAAGLDALAEAVEATPQITALWLKRNPLGPSAGPRLRHLITSSRLAVLDLTNTELGPAACEEVLAAVPGSRLQHVSLGAQGLTADSSEALARCLAGAAELRSLSLAVNHLGDAGVRVLAGGLARNQSLETLNLSSNGMGVEGLAALLAAAGSHPRLQELELGTAPSARALAPPPNRLAEGAETLSRFVAQRRLLRGLGLGGTALGSRGARPIVEALEHRQDPLRRLSLGPGVARSLRRRVSARLSPSPPPAHVSAIVSVYR